MTLPYPFSLPTQIDPHRHRLPAVAELPIAPRPHRRAQHPRPPTPPRARLLTAPRPRKSSPSRGRISGAPAGGLKHAHDLMHRRAPSSPAPAHRQASSSARPRPARSREPPRRGTHDATVQETRGVPQRRPPRPPAAPSPTTHHRVLLPSVASLRPPLVPSEIRRRIRRLFGTAVARGAVSAADTPGTMMPRHSHPLVHPDPAPPVVVPAQASAPPAPAQAPAPAAALQVQGPAPAPAQAQAQACLAAAAVGAMASTDGYASITGFRFVSISTFVNNVFGGAELSASPLTVEASSLNHQPEHVVCSNVGVLIEEPFPMLALDAQCKQLHDSMRDMMSVEDSVRRRLQSAKTKGRGRARLPQNGWPGSKIQQVKVD